MSASDRVDLGLPGKELNVWADEAMFTAEPLKADDGPKVYLLWMTPDPLGAVAAACKMYKGEVVRNIATDVTDAERRDYFDQIQRTKLKAPFEFVKLHFLVEGVTRSFTHQMVRQRTAVYAQESLRFAVKEDMAAGVALPPSLMGTDPELAGSTNAMRGVWDQAVRDVEKAYLGLIGAGMPAEDARGLLPHNITTRLHYAMDLRSLQDHAGNRLCTQAQFEWRMVWVRIIEAMRDYNPYAALSRSMSPMAAEQVQEFYESQRWQWELLAQLFRPVCYLTGKCEFGAEFDRKCSIRERVQAFHYAGISSEYWGDPQAVVSKIGKGGMSRIDPAEWLLDAAAAR